MTHKELRDEVIAALCAIMRNPSNPAAVPAAEALMRIAEDLQDEEFKAEQSGTPK